MSEFFVGQIMMTGFGYAPRYFALCNGQTLSISQNAALFSLLGTQYGGDGRSTFKLPDLQGRTPVGAGPSAVGGAPPYPEGANGGVETVALGASQMPVHSHMVTALTGAGTVIFATTPSLYATATVTPSGTEPIYAAPSAGPLTPLLAATVSTVGTGQPHDNMQPFRVINFNIALAGIFPSRN